MQEPFSALPSHTVGAVLAGIMRKLAVGALAHREAAHALALAGATRAVVRLPRASLLLLLLRLLRRLPGLWLLLRLLLPWLRLLLLLRRLPGLRLLLHLLLPLLRLLGGKILAGEILTGEILSEKSLRGRHKILRRARSRKILSGCCHESDLGRALRSLPIAIVVVAAPTVAIVVAVAATVVAVATSAVVVATSAVVAASISEGFRVCTRESSEAGDVLLVLFRDPVEASGHRSGHRLTEPLDGCHNGEARLGLRGRRFGQLLFGCNGDGSELAGRLRGFRLRCLDSFNIVVFLLPSSSCRRERLGDEGGGWGNRIRSGVGAKALQNRFEGVGRVPLYKGPPALLKLRELVKEFGIHCTVVAVIAHLQGGLVVDEQPINPTRKFAGGV